MNITEKEALRIAREDAQRVYVDLSVYRVSAEREGEHWIITYLPADPYTAGGGPHYKIAVHSGEILSRRYEQ